MAEQRAALCSSRACSRRTPRARTSSADSQSARLDTPSAHRPSAATQRPAAAGGGSTPPRPPGAAPQLAALWAAPADPHAPPWGPTVPGGPSSLRAAPWPIHAPRHNCVHAYPASRRRPEAQPAAALATVRDAWQPQASFSGTPGPSVACAIGRRAFEVVAPAGHSCGVLLTPPTRQSGGCKLAAAEWSQPHFQV